MTVTNQKEPNRLARYLREVRSEMSKVIWPSREQAFKLTMIVIAVMIVMAIYLGLLDFIFGSLIQWLLRAF